MGDGSRMLQSFFCLYRATLRAVVPLVALGMTRVGGAQASGGEVCRICHDAARWGALHIAQGEIGEDAASRSSSTLQTQRITYVLRMIPYDSRRLL